MLCKGTEILCGQFQWTSFMSSTSVCNSQQQESVTLHTPPPPPLFGRLKGLYIINRAVVMTLWNTLLSAPVQLENHTQI